MAEDLPPGFVLDAPASGADLPPGFVLDAAAPAAPPDPVMQPTLSAAMQPGFGAGAKPAPAVPAAAPAGTGSVSPIMRQGAKARVDIPAENPGVMDPRYPAWKRAQEQLERLGLVGDVVGAVAPFGGTLAKAGRFALDAAKPAASAVGQAASKLGLGKIGGAVKGVYSDFRGTAGKAARGEAQEATKGAVGQAADRLDFGATQSLRQAGELEARGKGVADQLEHLPEKEQAQGAAKGAVEGAVGKVEQEAGQEALRAKAMGDVKRQVTEKLEKARPQPLPLHKQGEEMRSQYDAAITKAEDARRERYKVENAQIESLAEEREAAGGRINTAAVEKELESAIHRAGANTGLVNSLKTMLGAIRGTGELAPAAEFKAPSLLDTIQKKGGITQKELFEIFGTRRVGADLKGIRPTLFHKGGQGLDDLANQLRAEGTKHYSFADQDRQWEFQRQQQAFGNQPKGNTYKQHDLTRRWLNKLAYGPPQEGFDAIAQQYAGDAAKGLEKAIDEFVPESATLRKNYGDMSKPLESLDTRLGKALSGSEGGFKGKGYDKVPDSALPGRVFSNKAGFDMMVDALAGGKNAEPEARAAAQAQVEKWAEDWIVASAPLNTPEKALEFLEKRQVKDVLTSAPKVEAAMKKLFGDMSGMDRTAKQLADMSTQRLTSAAERRAAAAKMRTDIQMADAWAAQAGAQSKKDAYNAYVKAMEGARKAGLVTDEQFQATAGLVDRAAVTEEKLTQLVKDLAQQAKQAEAAGKVSAAKAAELRSVIGQAEDKASQIGAKHKQEAYNSLRKALDDAAGSGLLPKPQYRATLELLSRADTLDEKTKLARRIAAGIAGVSATAVGAGAYIGGGGGH